MHKRRIKPILPLLIHKLLRKPDRSIHQRRLNPAALLIVFTSSLTYKWTELPKEFPKRRSMHEQLQYRI